MEGFRVACEHKRIRCTNCELFCADCGKKLDVAEIVKPENVGLPKRKTTKKKGAATE